MRKYGLVCKIRRVKRYGNTFEERRIENTFENQLNTVFDSDMPAEIFHTYITYLDLSFVISTLEKLAERTMDRNAIIHSDQGVHYTSQAYRAKLKEIGLEGSMSRRGRCVDNAPIETFFGHMKDEINFNKIKMYQEVVETIQKYMYDYNNTRPQWTLKKMTPIEYRNHLLNTA